MERKEAGERERKRSERKTEESERGERVKRNRIIVFMRRRVIVEVEFTLRS